MLHIESMRLAEEEAYLWLCENKNLIEKYCDDIFIEDVKVENFYRKYGYIIEKYDLFPDRHVKPINENWLGWTMDAIFAFGPMLPPPYGTSVAAAGAVYYVGFALKRFYDGDYFSALLDTIAAALSGAQVVYGAGTLAGASGKGVLAVIRATLGTALGRAARLVGTKITPGAIRGISRAEEMAEIAATLPMLTAAVQSLDDLIRVYNSNRAQFHAAFREMNVPIDKIDDMLLMSSELLDDLVAVAKAADKGDEALYAASIVKFAGASGKISKGQVDTILKEIDVVSDAMRAGDGVKVASQAAKLKSAEQFSTAAIAGKAALAGGRPVAPAITTALRGTAAGAKLATNPGRNILNAIAVSSGKTFNMYLERLASKVPGLLDEMAVELTRKFPSAFPAGTKILPSADNVTLKVVTPSGSTNYLRVFAQDGKSYTNLGEAILSSNAYKNYLRNAGTQFKALIDDAASKVGDQIFVQTIPMTTSTIRPLVTSLTPSTSKGFIATFISAKAAPLITFFSDPKKLKIAQVTTGVAGASETLASSMDFERSDFLRQLARENR